MSEPASTGARPGPGRLDRGVAAGMRWAAVACLVALLILVCMEILIRFIPVASLGWADEIVELAFAWMTFLGAAVLWRTGEHITIDFLPQALQGTWAGRVLDVVLGLLALAFLLVFTWYGWLLTRQAAGNTTPILELPKPWWYASIPVGGAAMIVYTLRRCLRAIRPAVRDSRGR